MARIRRTMTEAKEEAASQVDFAKLDAATVDVLALHAREDGFDPEAPFAGLVRRGGVSPVALRRQTGLSQDSFAAAIGVPVETIREWERGESVPDPAAQSLLKLIAADAPRALAILGR